MYLQCLMLLLEPKCWALSWSLGLRLSWLPRFIVYFLETSITRHQAQGSKYAVKWVWDPIGGNGVTCFFWFSSWVAIEAQLQMSQYECSNTIFHRVNEPCNSYSLFCTTFWSANYNLQTATTIWKPLSADLYLGSRLIQYWVPDSVSDSIPDWGSDSNSYQVPIPISHSTLHFKN